MTVARQAARIRSARLPGKAVHDRLFLWTVLVAAGLGWIWLPGGATAQNVVTTINDEFINDARLTTGLLVSGPPEVAREMAILGDSMFDAANAASGLAYPTVAYAGPAIGNASVDAAALAAGYTAMQGMFANYIWSGVPGQGTGGSAAVQATVLASLNATYASALNSLGLPQNSNTPDLTACANPSGGLVSLCGGISLGTTAANANLAAHGYTPGNNAVLANDGSATAILNGITSPYTPPNNNPGTYIPPTTRPAMFPQWGSVTPSGLTPAQMTGLEATVPHAPPITSATYAQNVLTTECKGSGTALPSAIQGVCAAAGLAPETTAEAKAALFWNDPGTTFTPPAHWLDIMNRLAVAKGLSTLQSARLASLLSEAENDAGIGAWEIKYDPANNLWRPITAIRDCTSWSANFASCDPAWTSLIATPPHPDYVAGHPAFSGAASKILQNFFGTNDIPITSVSDAYCNIGATLRGTPTGPVIACTVTPATPGSHLFIFNNAPTIFGPASACTALGGSLAVDGANNPVSCTIDADTFLFNPSQYASGTGCNDIVNGGSNDSPLICPITEVFDTISDASDGPNGAEFSRVAGGIHTPMAVEEALDLGNAIGQALASEANIPEPGAIGLLALPLGLFFGLRLHRVLPRAGARGRSGSGARAVSR